MKRTLILFAITVALISGATALYVKNGRVGLKPNKKTVTQLTNNEAFRSFCQSAVTSGDVFKSFKRDPIYNLFYENISYEQGELLHSLLKQQSPDLLRAELLEKFRRNDLIGMPRTYDFTGIGTFSPSTLRYMKIASDIQTQLGSLEGKHIVEIGGGYGGQCKVLTDLFNIASYTIVDLPEALELSKKYLGELGVKNVNFLTPGQISAQPYDLVISNYTFTESGAALQSLYFDKLLRHANMGYLTCNFFAKHFRVRPWTRDGLLKKFSALPVQLQLLNEEPQTGKDNFVLIWKKI